MSTRTFRSMADLGAAFARMAVEQHVVLSEAIGTASQIVEHHVHETFGDKTKLAELSAYTIADRTAKGHAPDQPLLIDGSLLRDSVQREHHDLEAGVGSAEPVMLYAELGYLNARTGTSVPPRPVFEIGLNESKAEIEAAVNASIDVLLNGRVKP